MPQYITTLINHKSTSAHFVVRKTAGFYSTLFTNTIILTEYLCNHNKTWAMQGHRGPE